MCNGGNTAQIVVGNSLSIWVGCVGDVLNDFCQPAKSKSGLPARIIRVCYSSPPDGYFGLRRGKFAAATLRADSGDSRIRMMAGAEFHVVTPSAIIAVERIAGSHSSAFVAILHGSSLMSGSV